jgi:hypothetical protein
MMLPPSVLAVFVLGRHKLVVCRCCCRRRWETGRSGSLRGAPRPHRGTRYRRLARREFLELPFPRAPAGVAEPDVVDPAPLHGRPDAAVGAQPPGRGGRRISSLGLLCDTLWFCRPALFGRRSSGAPNRSPRLRGGSRPCNRRGLGRGRRWAFRLPQFRLFVHLRTRRAPWGLSARHFRAQEPSADPRSRSLARSEPGSG